MDLIRIWKNMPVTEVDSHLLIVDDLAGYCQNCKTPGINYSQGINSCPKCKTTFKYISTREAPNTAVGQKILQKIFNLYPDALVIDYQDYKHLSDKKKAHSLFSTGDGE